MNDELRPKYLNDIIGQDKLKSCLKIAVDAAKKQNRSIENIFLEGMAGAGKTSIALAIGNELKSNTQIINCANLKDVKALYKILLTANDRDIIVFDEIHALNQKLQEIAYHAIEDNLLVIPDEKDTNKIKLKSFSCIGATTDSGKITKSLRDRFAFQFILDDYSISDMLKLCQINQSKLKLDLDLECQNYVAKMSKMTPRILNGRLKWIRDYKISKNINKLNINDVKSAFALYGLDNNGYSIEENEYIKIVKENGPIGIKHIAEIMGMGQGYIEQHIEKTLIKDGTIKKTPSGRVHKDYSDNDIKKILEKIL